jgi:hypothetical protein
MPVAKKQKSGSSIHGEPLFFGIRKVEITIKIDKWKS